MTMLVDAMDVTYEDVELLVYDTCHKFIARYHTGWEETLEEAQYHFVRAYHRYTKERGSFTNYVRFLIWHELQEWIRRKVSSSIRHPQVALDIEPRQDDERPSQGLGNLQFKRMGAGVFQKVTAGTFVLDEFVRDLSDDAKAVVRLTLDAPLDIQWAVKAQRKPTRQHWRAALTEFLADMGWTADRVASTFQEIGDALQ